MNIFLKKSSCVFLPSCILILPASLMRRLSSCQYLSSIYMYATLSPDLNHLSRLQESILSISSLSLSLQFLSLHLSLSSLPPPLSLPSQPFPVLLSPPPLSTPSSLPPSLSLLVFSMFFSSLHYLFHSSLSRIFFYFFLLLFPPSPSFQGSTLHYTKKYWFSEPILMSAVIHIKKTSCALCFSCWIKKILSTIGCQ